MEVRNRFKGLDLIDRVPDELWTDVHDIVQETGIKTIPKEKKCEKAKWLSEEALEIAMKTQQWPQDWKRSVFIPIPEKGNAKECSNYCTIAFISHASKVMLKIPQARL